jgi:hypothetical protein
VERHRLERVAEIAVVGIGARGNPRGDLLVELARIEAPSLARVAAKEQLLEHAPDGVDHHDFRGLDLLDRLAA